MKGLPGVHIGGMGIAVSPADHNVVYLIVEAAMDKGGFFRSTDRGASWQKMSDHHASGQYYNEIYCDPHDVNKVYSMETVSHVTLDGGKTWERVGLKARHVDDHAMWIDPRDTDHFLIGGDGGVYESYDGGENYIFRTNLPVTQFYRVNVDNEFPFYNVFGGTQDNNTLMGPSQTLSRQGISNEDWKAIRGGDGFWVAIDPEDPNIIYTEYQYGNSYRYDKRSGEEVLIKPRPRKGEETYKWNWNAPLVISKHSHTRLYAMANKVFRSDDRGNTWEVISPDLTSGMDRNNWPAMEHYWSYDAVVKDVSTSLFGTGVSFCESPLNEDLLYAGTDDGVLSITEDGGKNWRKVTEFPGVPEYTYISDIQADKFYENVVYVTFDNRKRDDFTPYVLKSDDKGRSWESIAGDLPEDETVHTLEQDPEVSGLLFAGTELGFYFSMDGGSDWTGLKSGLPSIAVRDMVIQERENDLVLATFGRGFYILDDYTPLREMAQEEGITEKKAHIFDIPEADMYIMEGGKYGQGSMFFTADNPPFGALFTYYLDEVPKTLRSMRHEKEKELFENKEPIPMPSREELRAEENELSPYLVFTVYDETGTPVRRLTESPRKGINRLNWDLRYNFPGPVDLNGRDFNPTRVESSGILALPGDYTVSMDLVVRGEITRLVDSEPFSASVLGLATLPAEDREEVVAFQEKMTRLARTMMGFDRQLSKDIETIQSIKHAIMETPEADLAMLDRVAKLEQKMKDLKFRYDGPSAKASWEELPPMDMPLSRRLSVMIRTHWNNTAGLTGTVQKQYEILAGLFPPMLNDFKEGHDELELIQAELDELGAPWTPGSVPSMN